MRCWWYIKNFNSPLPLAFSFSCCDRSACCLLLCNTASSCELCVSILGFAVRTHVVYEFLFVFCAQVVLVGATPHWIWIPTWIPRFLNIQHQQLLDKCPKGNKNPPLRRLRSSILRRSGGSDQQISRDLLLWHLVAVRRLATPPGEEDAPNDRARGPRFHRTSRRPDCMPHTPLSPRAEFRP